MKSNHSNIPTCELEDCNNLKRINIKKKCFSIGCCVNHSQQISNFINYGVSNTSKLLSVQKKREATNLKKYGTINAMSNKAVQKKFNESIKNKYGVDNYFQSIDFKNKSKKSLIEKFGVDNAMKCHTIKQKVKQTLFNNYGVSKELEDKGYSYSEILTNISDMPPIMYFFEGIEHRYYPDFFYTIREYYNRSQKRIYITQGMG